MSIISRSLTVDLGSEDAFWYLPTVLTTTEVSAYVNTRKSPRIRRYLSVGFLFITGDLKRPRKNVFPRLDLTILIKVYKR